MAPTMEPRAEASLEGPGAGAWVVGPVTRTPLSAMTALREAATKMTAQATFFISIVISVDVIDKKNRRIY